MTRPRPQRADPLAGQREAINTGEADALLWPDQGRGQPVEVGDVFRLRSCEIHITRVHRVTARGTWSWRAEFERHYPADRPHILTRGAGDGHGYTTNPQQAIRAQDDPNAATLDTIADLDRSEAHRDVGEPPEPESIPTHEVIHLPSSQAARERYRQLHAEQIEKRLDRSMTSKLREVRIRARSLGVDVSEEMDVIVAATERARLKLRQVA